MNMKYNKLYILAALAGLMAAAVSCSLNESFPEPGLEEQESSQPRFTQFYVSTEGYVDTGISVTPQTRVAADPAIHLYWESGDAISIFNQSTVNLQYAFAGETGDWGGVFNPVDPDASAGEATLESVYAVYPYASATSLSADGTVSYEFPAVQTYREDSFGPGANPMLAVATNTNELQFKNLGGLLAVSMYGTGITVSSLVLQGNSGELLAGPATVTADAEGTPVVAMDAATATDKITLNFTDPVTIGTTAEEASVFWIVLPPTTFSAGFTVTVNWTDGKSDYVFEKTTSKNITVRRNGVVRMAALDGGVVPTAIAIDPSIVKILPGKTITLQAVFTPSNTTYDDVTWKSNNTSVATVTQDGVVTTLAVGKARITCTTKYGSTTRAVCNVYVKENMDPEVVDLGLPNGAKWASFNLGATAPEELGGYYAWGEVEKKTSYTLSNYEWYSSGAMTKYNASDDIAILETSDDAARSALGGKWRLPTMSETMELKNMCTWSRTTEGGVSGYKVTSKTNGNSIFIPDCGYMDGSTLKDAKFGYYWAASVDDSDYSNAHALYFSGIIKGSDELLPRYQGMQIRPVMK